MKKKTKRKNRSIFIGLVVLIGFSLGLLGLSNLKSIGGLSLLTASTGSSNTFVSVNAASYLQKTLSVYSPTAPLIHKGSLLAGFGSGLSSQICFAPNQTNLPEELCGVKIKLGVEKSTNRDVYAKLSFVSPGQINYYFPYKQFTEEVYKSVPFQVANLQVLKNNTVVGTAKHSIAVNDFGLFTTAATGKGVASGLYLRVHPTTKAIVYTQSLNQPIKVNPNDGLLDYIAVLGTGFGFEDGAVGPYCAGYILKNQSGSKIHERNDCTTYDVMVDRAGSFPGLNRYFALVPKNISTSLNGTYKIQFFSSGDSGEFLEESRSNFTDVSFSTTTSGISSNPTVSYLGATVNFGDITQLLQKPLRRPTPQQNPPPVRYDLEVVGGASPLSHFVTSGTKGATIFKVTLKAGSKDILPGILEFSTENNPDTGGVNFIANNAVLQSIPSFVERTSANSYFSFPFPDPIKANTSATFEITAYSIDYPGSDNPFKINLNKVTNFEDVSKVYNVKGLPYTNSVQVNGLGAKLLVNGSRSASVSVQNSNGSFLFTWEGFGFPTKCSFSGDTGLAQSIASQLLAVRTPLKGSYRFPVRGISTSNTGTHTISYTCSSGPKTVTTTSKVHLTNR